ncbi:MAG: LacI family transcriptional regulator [Bacteroidales bacterium]|jgi:LacI family transcriptional regulator|nr:LacI family transcriptional regulator [Bacteroidales bacterium]
MVKKKSHKVSMQNIADAVGVARSTVSFVLNGKEKEGRISKEIAQKVQAAAKAMNYQINELARSLRTGSSNTIALVIADISDPFFGTLAYYLQEYAESKGYAMIIINTGEKQERLAPIITMLTNRQVDGIIMVPVSGIEEGKIEQINPDIPMVFIDRYFKTLNTSRVCINNYEVSKMATQLLIRKGCKRIVFISYRESLMHLQDRKRGFVDTLSANHLLDESLICEVDYHNRQVETVEFLKKILEPANHIDGILTATGGLSSIAIRCMANMGIKLQSDVQVVAFGRVDTAVGVSIPYVKQPMEEICRYSFDILMNRIKSSDSKAIDCVVPASIVTDQI